MGTIIIKHENLESMQVYEDRGILRTSHGQAVDTEQCQVLCGWCCKPLDQDNEEEMYQKAHEDCRLHAENLGGIV